MGALRRLATCGAARGARRTLLAGVAIAAVAAAAASSAGAGAAHADGLRAAAAAAADAAPAAEAPRDAPVLARGGAAGHALHEEYAPLLHPSTLELSDYPTSGGGETADLTFAVTYMGGWEEGAAAAAASWRPGGGHPPVRLDVTGSEYPGMYRVTNITSDVGAPGAGVFAPYDHETEAAVAEPGRTYTVRAQIEILVEGFVPVYALGLDGDIVTVDVAASPGQSMPYTEYLAKGEDYLDHLLAEPGPIVARERPPDAGSLAALEERHGGSLKGMLSPVAPLRESPAPLSESSMPAVFGATGIVTTVDFDAVGVAPVHGIQVCAYDLSLDAAGRQIHTLLNTTAAGDPACGYTDAGGRYNITSVAGADPHDATRADVFVAVFSRGYGGLVELATYDRGYYYLYEVSDMANVSVDYNGTMRVVDIDIARDGTGMDGAARIISTLSDGLAFFERLGHAPANLTVQWHHASGSQIFPDKAGNGAAYLPGDAVMWLDGPSRPTGRGDSFDRRVILHELAHHVHTVHDPDLEFHCLPHWYTLKHDERCAWGEGWAQVVPHLVYDSAVLLDGPAPAVWYDIERGVIGIGSMSNIIRQSDTFDASGRPIGDQVEGSVAAAMWDLADVENSTDRDMRTVQGGFNGSDDVAAGADAVVSVFLNGTYDSFADFYDRWEIDMRRHSAERVAILHGMSFAIPNSVPYYGFAGELDGVFKRGLAYLALRPSYVDVSDDGSTVAVTSQRGRGLQLVNTSGGGEHLGLHAARGYDYNCMFERNSLACLAQYANRATDGLSYGQFSHMDGVAFDSAGRFILVTDGPADRVQILRADGRHAGQFGTAGDGDGEFDVPDGVAFLPDGRAAVADTANLRVQVFNIASNGSGAAYDAQFESYAPDSRAQYTWQQLAAGPNGSLHAADYNLPRIWIFPPGLDTGTAVRIDDDRRWRPDSDGGLGGIAVGPNGLVYASNWIGYVRVYNSSSGVVPDSSLQLGGRSVDVYSVQSNPDLIVDEFGSSGRHAWQLGQPLGVALGPPDNRTGDVRVYIADVNGVKMYEKDREAPRVESVWAHTPDGNMTAGSTVEIAVNFSERVTVTGEPVLRLDAGAPGANATYASGSGSRTLSFNYTVPAAASPAHLDYLGTDSLVLAASSGDPGTAAVIMDGSGNAANLTLPARGTAGSLAANSALWVDPVGGSSHPLAIMRGPAVVAAVEGEEVRFAVNVTGPAAATGAVSYSLAGAPEGASIDPANGTFSWTPSEGQDGIHAPVVNATQQGNSSVRTFLIAVAEDNEPPSVGPIPDMNASELSELRFDVQAADADLPAQRLEYRLEGLIPWGSTILPNGTFAWTPNVYHGGETYTLNVSVSDGFGGGDGDRAGKTSAAFNVTVQHVPQDVPTITIDRVYSRFGGLYVEGQTVLIEIEFSAPVKVVGSPELLLNVGPGRTAVAEHNGTYGRIALFEYAVEAGHRSFDLDYSGIDALNASGAMILAASGENVVNLTLPVPGTRGSLSQTSDVYIFTTDPGPTDPGPTDPGPTDPGPTDPGPTDPPPALSRGPTSLRIGVIGDRDTGGTAEAARLAAYDFGLGPGSTQLDITVTEHAAGVNASTVEDALRAAHANGTGPGLYVGPLDDETLHAAMPYANESGIVLVSTASTAPSLAVENDTVLRLVPGDAMRDVALAWLVTGSTPSSVHVVVDERYGLTNQTVDVPPPPGSFQRGSIETFANLTSPPATTWLSASNTTWADEAEGVANAINSSGGGRAAVVFFGLDSNLTDFARQASNHTELLSARWFAAGPSGPPDYLKAGPLPAVLTNLTAVSWTEPVNDVTARIDANLSATGADSNLRAYAAYDAVRLLGWAASAAAGNMTPSAVAAAVADAAEHGMPLPPPARGGALGGIALDQAGDLFLPDRYDMWTMVNADGTAWNQTGQGLVSGTPTCAAHLSSPSLDFNVIPGNLTVPRMQTVINSGQLQISTVELNASPWRIDPDARGAADTSAMTLPALLAEMSKDGPRADYSAVSNGTVAENVSVGASVPMWLRINLTGHGDLSGSTMVQSTTYTVSCDGAGP